MASEREHGYELPPRQGRKVLHAGVRIVAERYTEWDDEPNWAGWDFSGWWVHSRRTGRTTALQDLVDAMSKALPDEQQIRQISGIGTSFHEAMENMISADTHLKGFTADRMWVDEADLKPEDLLEEKPGIVTRRGDGKSHVHIRAIRPLRIQPIVFPKIQPPAQKQYPGSRSLRRRDNR